MIYYFFGIFEKWTHCCRSGIFLWVNSKKSAKFSFSKNHRELKNEYFFENVQIPSFISKNTGQKIKFEIKIFKTFYFGPPKWAKWFLTWAKEKAKTIELLFIYSQRRHSSLAQAPKAFFIVCPFKGKSQNFLRPCAKVKSNISKWNFWLDWGCTRALLIAIWHNVECVQFFSSKITPS